jgi:hypothetical protein
MRTSSRSHRSSLKERKNRVCEVPSTDGNSRAGADAGIKAGAEPPAKRESEPADKSTEVCQMSGSMSTNAHVVVSFSLCSLNGDVVLARRSTTRRSLGPTG